MTVQILRGHVLDRLRDIPDEYIHCIITSPPYWGLRAYGTVPQIWGGDSDCRHDFAAQIVGDKRKGQRGKSSCIADRETSEAQVAGRQQERGCFCRRCGAWRGEHGLEPSLGLWVMNEVIIWRELRRVLRKDGVAWLNMGDCYAGGPNGRSAADTKALGNDDRTFRDKPFSTVGPVLSSLPEGYDQHGKSTTVQGVQSPNTSSRVHAGGFIKPKDRVMLPARLALALQDDGWFLRDEIVWSKPNTMPSSVRDRTTPAHEMVYLLTKRGRYFFDDVAIREPFAAASVARLSQPSIGQQRGGVKQDEFEALGLNVRGGSRRPNEIVQGLAQRIKRKPAGWDNQPGAHSTLRHAASKSSGNKERKFGDAVGRPGSDLGGSVPWEGFDRNKRSIWTIPTESFPEKHFATFPTALVEPMVKAGTSEKGCCPGCDAPMVRQTKKRANGRVRNRGGGGLGTEIRGSPKGLEPITGTFQEDVQYQTVGWAASCTCGCEPVPCRILDPFAGSGTVGLVADRLKRDAVLIELNHEYAEMAKRRIEGDAPLFVEVSIHA